MQQIRASAFYTVGRWHKLGEVDNECTSHNFIILTIRTAKIVKFGRLEIWRSLDKNKLGHFLAHPVYVFVCVCVCARPGTIICYATSPS